jgi:hypothetical protein
LLAYCENTLILPHSNAGALQTSDNFLSAGCQWVRSYEFADLIHVIRVFGQQSLHAVCIRFKAQWSERRPTMMRHVSVIADDVTESGLLCPLAKIIFFTVSTAKCVFIEEADVLDGLPGDGHAKTDRRWNVGVDRLTAGGYHFGNRV